MYDDVKRHAFFEKKREKNVMRIRRRCFQCYAALDHLEFTVCKYVQLRICRDLRCPLVSVVAHVNYLFIGFFLLFYTAVALTVMINMSPSFSALPNNLKLCHHF